MLTNRNATASQLPSTVDRDIDLLSNTPKAAQKLRMDRYSDKYTTQNADGSTMPATATAASMSDFAHPERTTPSRTMQMRKEVSASHRNHNDDAGMTPTTSLANFKALPPTPPFQSSLATPTPTPRHRLTTTSNENSPPIADAGNLLTPTSHHQALRRRPGPHKPTIVGYSSYEPAPPATPPLPRFWSAQHDRAICILDTRGYEPSQMIARLRRAFPELGTRVLTAGMIDLRLRRLDQDVECDYWRKELLAERKKGERGESPTTGRGGGGGAGATVRAVRKDSLPLLPSPQSTNKLDSQRDYYHAVTNDTVPFQGGWRSRTNFPEQAD